MKRILLYTGIAVLHACEGNSVETVAKPESLEKNKMNSIMGYCPYGHKDSVIPIVYGYPSEEDFQKSDSGMIALGGCEIPLEPDNWFCKIHKVAF